jgi:hypothetical protein
VRQIPTQIYMPPVHASMCMPTCTPSRALAIFLAFGRQTILITFSQSAQFLRQLTWQATSLQSYVVPNMSMANRQWHDHHTANLAGEVITEYTKGPTVYFSLQRLWRTGSAIFCPESCHCRSDCGVPTVGYATNSLQCHQVTVCSCRDLGEDETHRQPTFA